MWATITVVSFSDGTHKCKCVCARVCIPTWLKRRLLTSAPLLLPIHSLLCLCTPECARSISMQSRMHVQQGQMLKRSDLRSIVAAVIDSFPASGAFGVHVLQGNRRGAVTKPPRSGPRSRLFLHVLGCRAAESFTGSCVVRSLVYTLPSLCALT